MKVVISATGKDIESNINARFGRAPFFLIIDTKTNEEKVIDNTSRELESGVGVTVGNIVAREEVDAVIASDIGPLAFETFDQCGIKIYKANGKIKNAIQQFVEGKLPEIIKATVSKFDGKK